ncbi:MAG: hypothetical protein J5821_01820 [Alphaproteobacteria bacterium]|nr:hypothetical protein [Alphaproteobacteria bacterium]
MKKLAFSVFAAALTFGANAADDVEVAAASESCCGYDGFYFGMGIAATDSGVKTETTYAYGQDSSGNVGTLSDDFGVDTNDHDTRFIGSLTLGYGKRIKERAYLGLEAGLDAGKNSNFVHAGMYSVNGKTFEVQSRQNGLVPSVALKLGYVHPGTRGMVYLKAGAAYSKAKTDYTDWDVVANKVFPYNGSCSKWAPIVALGGEKLCGKNIRTRLEVEYRFGANKKFDFNNGVTDGVGDYRGTVKLTSKDAITLRAMAVYTVKM